VRALHAFFSSEYPGDGFEASARRAREVAIGTFTQQRSTLPSRAARPLESVQSIKQNNTQSTPCAAHEERFA